MKILTTYEITQTRYLTQLKEIEVKLRKGKSKHKNANLQDMTYYFDYCVTIPFESPPSSVEDWVKFQMKNSRTALCASIGKALYQVLIDNPPELEDRYRCSFLKSEEERNTYDALGVEEKQKEFENALSQLIGKPGFFIL